MTHPFKTLHHVCIVVHDLEKTVAWYESLGVGPWFDYPKSSPYTTFEVPNPVASANMRYRCCDLDNMQLQICDPGALDSPQKRYLDTHGEGVYHLGFEVADLAAAEAHMRAHEVGVTARGRRADGSGFAYFDTRGEAGTVLEVRRTV